MATAGRQAAGISRQVRRVSRRKLLVAAAAAVAAAPVVRVGVMRLKDNPLPAVAAPSLVFADGWVLDAGDLEGGR